MQTKNPRAVPCLIATTVASAIALAGARAALAATADDTIDGKAVLLQEVVVTAQRRSQSIQEVPGAVTAVTADALRSNNANALEDYFRQVPSLAAIPGSEGTMQLSIRGVNSSGFTGPTVGIYVDETPIGTTVSGDHANELVPDLDPSDLARVEVLQGPQGTLYGAANMGGLVKFVTAEPNLREYSGRLQVDGSAVDHGGTGYVARGAVTGPIVSDRLAVRVSAFTREDPGFLNDPGVIANKATNQNLAQPRNTDLNATRIFGGHASILWKISDGLRVKLSALYQGHEGEGQTEEDFNGLTQKPLYGDLTQITSRFAGRSSIRLQVYNATLNWNLPWATLMSSTSDAINDYHSVTDITGLVPPSPTSGFPPSLPLTQGGVFFPNAGAGYFTYPSLPSAYYTPVTLRYRTGKLTQEVRLTSPSSQTLEWLTGFFYTHEATHSYQRIDLSDPDTGEPYALTGICAPPMAVTFPPPLPPITFPPCKAMQAAAPAGTTLHDQLSSTGYREYSEYGDLTYHLTSRLSVEGGARLSKYRETFGETYDGILDFLSNHQQFSGSIDSPTADGSKITYLAAIRYRLTEHVMAYTRFATGYRPGGANSETVTSAPRFGPDTTNNYEAGIKSTLAGGRVILDADGYVIDWQKIQLETTTASDFIYFVNGGSARSDGMELEATVLPLERLRLSATAAYNHAYLTADIPSVVAVDGRKGDPLPYSPTWTGTFSLDYGIPLGDALLGHVGADYDYVDGVFDNFYPCGAGGCSVAAALPPSRVELAPYSLVNLHSGLSWGPWTLNLFVKNLFDKRAFVSDSVQHATFARAVPNGQYVPDTATMLTPRTFVLSIAREF